MKLNLFAHKKHMNVCVQNQPLMWLNYYNKKKKNNKINKQNKILRRKAYDKIYFGKLRLQGTVASFDDFVLQKYHIDDMTI